MSKRITVRKNSVVLIFPHIQCLHLMYSEVAWALVFSETQVWSQTILDPDYLLDYLSVYCKFSNSFISASKNILFFWFEIFSKISFRKVFWRNLTFFFRIYLGLNDFIGLWLIIIILFVPKEKFHRLIKAQMNKNWLSLLVALLGYMYFICKVSDGEWFVIIAYIRHNLIKRFKSFIKCY